MKQSWVVYCDFDGTITSTDCVDFLLNRLAAPEWRILEAMWEQNLITSRECMKAQIPLIQGGWKAIEACLDEITITPGFENFSRWCRNQKIPLYIVSEGLDLVIDTLLRRIDVHVDGVFANRLEIKKRSPLALTFPFSRGDGPCDLGLCKCQMLERSPNETTRIVIGDGASDYCWAEEADLLFARKKLETYCEQKQIPFFPFKDFTDIQNHLQEILQKEREIAVPA